MSVSVLEINIYVQARHSGVYHAGFKLVFQGFCEALGSIDLVGRADAISPSGAATHSIPAYLYNFNELHYERDALHAADSAVERAELGLIALIDSDQEERPARRFGDGTVAMQELQRIRDARSARNDLHRSNIAFGQALEQLREQQLIEPSEYQFGWSGLRDPGAPQPRRAGPPRKPSPLVEFPEDRKITLK